MSMPSLGYTAIPDVEAGVINSITEQAQKRYPEANAAEAAFLGMLDDAIEKAKPEIILPKVNATDIGPPTSIQEFLQSLRLPTAALLISLLSGILVIWTNSPLAKAMYPYYTCILIFVSSIPASTKRVQSQVAPVITRVDSTKTQVENQVSEVSSKALSLLDQTERAMNTAIAPIKSKADYATKVETMLKLIDPTIDIPDTTDIEKGFDGFQDLIQSGCSTVMDAVDISKSIPKACQSWHQFQCFVVYPVLALFLVLQLVAVYHTSTSTSSTTDTLHRTLLQATTTSSEFTILFVALQSYITTAIQLGTSFALTQANSMALMVNHTVLLPVERNVNKTLEQQLGQVFSTIFTKGFGFIRQQMLDLIRKMELIEGPLKSFQKNLPAGIDAAALENVEQKLSSGLGSFFGRK